jgi:hypothetical protein
MFQKRPIYAPLVDGVQKPIVKTQVEFYKDMASTPTGFAIAEGCYVAGYDEDNNLKAVRRIGLETENERKLLKSGDLETLTNIYHHTLQFRA